MSSSNRLAATIPAVDSERKLTIAWPDNPNLPHIGLVGDTYTILVAGKDTAGRYCLIDMHIPPGGGPPPHRHDFEEMFSVLEGEIEATFRGKKTIIRAGETISISGKRASPIPETKAGNPRGCCAYARRLGRKSFSRRLVFPSLRGRHHRRSSTTWPKQRS